MEWKVPDYQDKCVTASPEEDGQEGDLRRDGGRPEQITRSVTEKEEDDDFQKCLFVCTFCVEYFQLNHKNCSNWPVVKSLTCCLIHFCLHRSLISETPGEDPKQEVSKLISV